MFHASANKTCYFGPRGYWNLHIMLVWKLGCHTMPTIWEWVLTQVTMVCSRLFSLPSSPPLSLSLSPTSSDHVLYSILWKIILWMSAIAILKSLSSYHWAEQASVSSLQCVISPQAPCTHVHVYVCTHVCLQLSINQEVFIGKFPR